MIAAINRANQLSTRRRSDIILVFISSVLRAHAKRHTPKYPEMSVPQVVSDLESAAAATRRVEG